MPRCFVLGVFHPKLAPPRPVVVVEDAGPLPLRKYSHTRSTVNTPQSSAQPNHCLFNEALARQTHTTESQAEPLPKTAKQLEYKTDYLLVSPPGAATSHRDTGSRGQTGALVNQDRGRHIVGHSFGAQYIRESVAFDTGITRKPKHDYTQSVPQ